MAIRRYDMTKIWRLKKNLFSNNEYCYSASIGSRVMVNVEPSGQEVLDTGELVPVFEAIVLDGGNTGFCIQVAEEELETV